MSDKVKGWKSKWSRMLITSVFLFTLGINFLVPFGIASNRSIMDPIAAGNTNELSTSWEFARGMPGTGATMQPRIVNLTSDGKQYILTGNDQGLGIVNSEGIVKANFLTPGPVIDFEVTDDVSGDNQKDVIVVCLFQESANVYCIDSNTGNELWSFDATILGFDQTNYIPKNFTTNTWDCVVVNDIDGDSISEVAVASWYRVFLVNGKTGAKIWEISDKTDLSDDVWKLEKISDINNNGYEEIIAGSEAGEIVVIDSKTGVKIYATAIPKRTLWTYGSTPQGVQKEVVISVTDLKIIADQNGDSTPEILIGGNDGIVRMLSGKTGESLYTVTVHAVTIPTTPVYTQKNGELYSYTNRLFQKYGLKFISCPDLNNDGQEELVTYSHGLELSSSGGSSQNIIQMKVVTINASGLSIYTAANFSYDTFRYFSYPVVQKVGTQYRICFYSPMGMNNYQKGVFYFRLQSTISATPIFLLQTWEWSNWISYDYNSMISTQMNLACDKSGDGVPDFFVFSLNGEYMLIDAVDGTTIWKRSKKTSQASVKEIQDLNGDGIKDLLYTSEIEFSPEWKTSSQGGNSYRSSESTNIIVEIAALNAKDGKIIWSYDSPSSIYEGVRDLIEIGDINGDGITDYAGWIIPSYVPEEIKAYIRGISGTESVLNAQSGDWQTDAQAMVYRALLTNYTRFITINGSNGKTIMNQPLIEMPYNFLRDGSTLGNYYNRINGLAHNSWMNGNFDDYEWQNSWFAESLLHTNKINVESGDDVRGDAFDVWGNQGSTYNITSVNGSALLVNGLSANISASGIENLNDNVFWFINSTKLGTEDKIIIENSYTLTEMINSPIQNLSIEYSGALSLNVYSIVIFAWNFNAQTWIPISNALINASSMMTAQYYLPSVADFCGENNLTKIRVEVNDPLKNFTLNLEGLTMKYIFKYQNMSISAKLDGANYGVLLNMSYYVNFSSDPLLGSMDYPLSQIQRASAIKIQSYLTVNESLYYDYFNFTYALWNFTSGQWIQCNWSTGVSWSSGAAVFPDLHGNYANTRTDYKNFQFDSNQYKTDSMYLMTRGTHDDPSYQLDYLNASTISDFIDPTTKEIKLRVNITNPMRDFNATFDTLGIQAFYWDITPMRFDPRYVYDYRYSSWMGVQPTFTTSGLRNIEVQDIALINGTGDKYLDVVVVLGYTKISYTGTTNLRLFDVKNNAVYSMWNDEANVIPKEGVRVASYNLKGVNRWIISGMFYIDSQYRRLTTLINDTNCKWNSGYTFFKPYADSNSYLNFTQTLNLTLNINYGNKEYYPGIIYYTTARNIPAIQILEYVDTGSPANIMLYEIENLTLVGKIPITGLYQDMSGSGYNSYAMSEMSPVTPLSAFLNIAADDFNGDGMLDSIGYYLESEIKYLRVYSGLLTNNEPVKLKEMQFQSSNMYGGNTQIASLNFISVGDLDGDGGAEIAYGEQTSSSGWGSASKGASISFLNLKTSTSSEWVLDEWVSPPWDSQIYKVFVDSIKKVGDINNDGYTDVLITHNVYFEGVSYGSYKNYLSEKITEIVDVKNQKILMRFGITADSLLQCSDISGDGINDFIITAGEIVYCLNSAFKVRLTNLVDDQLMASNMFTIEWTSNSSSGVYYELEVQGNRYGYTTATSAEVSLGAGEKLIQISMRDQKGIVIAIDSVKIVVPANNTMMLYTIGMVVGLVVITMIYKGIKKKQAQKVLVD